MQRNEGGQQRGVVRQAAARAWRAVAPTARPAAAMADPWAAVWGRRLEEIDDQGFFTAADPPSAAPADPPPWWEELGPVGWADPTLGFCGWAELPQVDDVRMFQRELARVVLLPLLILCVVLLAVAWLVMAM
jgi:hypothetical protein